MPFLKLVAFLFTEYVSVQFSALKCESNQLPVWSVLTPISPEQFFGSRSKHFPLGCWGSKRKTTRPICPSHTITEKLLRARKVLQHCPSTHQLRLKARDKMSGANLCHLASYRSCLYTVQLKDRSLAIRCSRRSWFRSFQARRAFVESIW